MFLAHCMMEWTLLAVLSLCLPVWSAIKVIQPYRVESTNGTAQLQCFIQSSFDQRPSYPYPEELRVTLLKGLHGTQKLCSCILNPTEQRETDVEKEKEEKVQCSAHLRANVVEVTVSGLKVSDTDMYRCEMKVFYPPPYLQLTGNGTLIHVIGSSDCPEHVAQRQTAPIGGVEEEDEGNERMAPVSVPVGVLSIMVVVVLIIIIAFQALQCDRRKREIVRPVPAVLHKMDAAAFSCENIA